MMERIMPVTPITTWRLYDLVGNRNHGFDSWNHLAGLVVQPTENT